MIGFPGAMNCLRSSRPLTRWRSLAIAVVTLLGVVASVGGCAIQADSEPRSVPDEHPARVVLDPTGDGGEATGEGRIYLLAPEGSAQSLRTVLRDSEQLIQTLVRGPNDEELSDGLTSDLPPTLEVRDVRFEGSALSIDLSADIDELQGGRLVLAVAQLVFTASEIPGAESVVILVEGERRSWPNGDGDLTSEPLTVYDFAGFAESSQPAYPVAPSPMPRAVSAGATTTTAVAATTTTAPPTVP